MDYHTTMDSHATEENNAHQGSKLSLGSSPSALSADEQLEGEGPLTPTDKLQDDDEEEEEEEEKHKKGNSNDDEEDDSDDDLSALNSILQAGSAGSLSDEEEDEEDEEDAKTMTTTTRPTEEDEQDSASPLSSVPEDFPLSRSASPELPLVEPLSKQTEEMASIKSEKEDDEEEEEEKKPTTRKRRKDSLGRKSTHKKDSTDSNEPPESKRPKLSDPSSSHTTHSNHTSHRVAYDSADDEEDTSRHHIQHTRHGSSDETVPKNKRRRVSRSSILELETSRPRRRQSKDEPVIKKEEEDPMDISEDTPETSTASTTDKPKKPVVDKSDIEHPPESPKTVPPEKDEGEELEEEMEDLQSKEKKKRKEDLVEPANHESHDDHDYQQRHKEALDALTHIEVEFARLRDKMYQEKMSELNEEAIMIANGTHPELVTLMAEIEEKKGKRIHSAEAWRRYQHANFRQQFEGFEYQANIHFISQRNALRRQLLEQINGKRWSIEDERSKLNDPSKNGHLFPDGREMIAHKRELKEETGELQDIKEAIGFPMAPNPAGLNAHDLNEDLKLLGIHRH